MLSSRARPGDRPSPRPRISRRSSGLRAAASGTELPRLAAGAAIPDRRRCSSSYRKWQRDRDRLRADSSLVPRGALCQLRTQSLQNLVDAPWHGTGVIARLELRDLRAQSLGSRRKTPQLKRRFHPILQREISASIHQSHESSRERTIRLFAGPACCPRLAARGLLPAARSHAAPGSSLPPDHVLCLPCCAAAFATYLWGAGAAGIIGDDCMSN